MADETPAPFPQAIAPGVVAPSSTPYDQGWSDAAFAKVQKELRDPNRQRGLVFENDKQRNISALKKGLTKPGRISYDTLRRIALSVYAARICINHLKSKVTQTKWVIQPIDIMKRKGAESVDKRIKEVTDLFKHPNQNDETFRTMLDKMTEDLLVLDAVSIEKVRYPDGTLAELHFVDSATIRPVYDEHGNQDILVPLHTVNGDEELPVSYLQILNNSQYGGPESGDIIAAWPKRDFLYFHMHPQGAMQSFGYGLSPLEGVLSIVSNLLNSDNYNSTYFEEGAFPPVILNVVGQINQRDLDAFKEYFYQEINGNFHRPALLASQNKSEVINLKDFTNRDMQFMEFTILLIKMLCAAYEMSPNDIGLTDSVGSKNVGKNQTDISDSKGYSSILDLYKQIFNQEIIWKDFGYDDLEFEWVVDDSIAPVDASVIYDRDLRNGSRTLNEVRQKIGETPFGDWADEPMIFTGSAYAPIEPGAAMEHATDMEAIVGGEKPYQEQDGSEASKEGKGDDDVKKTRKALSKSVLTPTGMKIWMDDRGTAQPFIFMDIKGGSGMVIKPPVAVNLESQNLEIALTEQLAGMGLNVKPVRKLTYVEVCDMLRMTPDVFMEFERYCMMTPEYDSEKYRAKYGGSRKFSYYLVSEYIDGNSLSNPLLLADMKRDPDSYMGAVHDLAQLWKAERDMVLGDRRADQYIIGHDKRAYGFDYQFMGDVQRWEKNKDAIAEALATVPELKAAFEVGLGSNSFSIKSRLEKWARKTKLIK
jgi:hypothetical protein